MSHSLSLNLDTTTLLAIDLQKGILSSGSFLPYTATDVLTVSDKLADFLQDTPAYITLVNVDISTFSSLYPFQKSPYEVPADFCELQMAIANKHSDNLLKITKYNPGAFFGTDLDLQLRRRGITTIILTGIATTNGVYATALEAYQRGYQVIVLEDACTDRDEELHRIFFDKLFPRISQITTSKKLLTTLKEEN